MSTTHDENTGSFPPAPGPVRSFGHGDSVLRIDGRTLAMAALFLVGGAGAGGGASFFGGSAVRDDMEKLSAKLDDVKNDLDDLKKRSEVEQLYRRLVDDHEQRIRSLERKVP